MKCVYACVLFLVMSSAAFANYRCSNWAIQSIGADTVQQFVYVNGGVCRRYQPGQSPFSGPVVPKKTPFFKIVFRGGSMDAMIRTLTNRADAFERFLEFDITDGAFANSPDELGIDLSSQNISMVNLVGGRLP